MFFVITTVVFFITTVLFGLMAFLPSAAPIKSKATRAAAQVSSQEQITKVATRFTGNLVTFDYRTLDADLQRITRDATGNFQNQFHTALGGDLNVFRRAIEGSQAQSTGDVKGTSVSSRDESTATVLVFVSQTIRNKTHPAPRTELRLLELTLVKTAQGWKVDNVGNPARTTQ
jgi:Mce-associated membrane protein